MIMQLISRSKWIIKERFAMMRSFTRTTPVALGLLFRINKVSVSALSTASHDRRQR